MWFGLSLSISTRTISLYNILAHEVGTTVYLPDGEAAVQRGSETVLRSWSKKVGKPGLGWNPRVSHLRFLALHLQALQTWQLNLTLENLIRDFPGGPVGKNPPCKAGEKK